MSADDLCICRSWWLVMHTVPLRIIFSCWQMGKTEAWSLNDLNVQGYMNTVK